MGSKPEISVFCKRIRLSLRKRTKILEFKKRAGSALLSDSVEKVCSEGLSGFDHHCTIVISRGGGPPGFLFKPQRAAPGMRISAVGRRISEVTLAIQNHRNLPRRKGLPLGKRRC